MDVIALLEENVELVFGVLMFLLVYAGIDLYLIKKKIKEAKILLEALDEALADDKITAEEWANRIKPALNDLFGVLLSSLVSRLFRRA